MFGEIFPLTHFLRVTRAVMLKSADFTAISLEVGWLAFFMVQFANIALLLPCDAGLNISRRKHC